MNEFKIEPFVYWVKITQKDPKGQTIKTKVWKDLQFKTRLKFDWYFKYIAAKWQIEQPKGEIIFSHGKELATGENLTKANKDKARATKAKITQFENKLEAFKKNYNSLFPIETDIQYQKASQKIAALKAKLKTL